MLDFSHESSFLQFSVRGCSGVILRTSITRPDRDGVSYRFPYISVRVQPFVSRKAGPLRRPAFPLFVTRRSDAQLPAGARIDWPRTLILTALRSSLRGPHGSAQAHVTDHLPPGVLGSPGELKNYGRRRAFIDRFLQIA